MKKSQIIIIMARIGFFLLILSLGTLAALMLDESEGLAWTDMSGASIQAIAATSWGNTLCAAQTGSQQPAGIYCSHDGGRTWKNTCSGPGMAVRALAIHPADEAVLYAGTEGGPMDTAPSLWRSPDGGRTWHEFFLSLPANPYEQIPAVTTLAVDPEQPEALYVGTDGQGVYRFDEKRLGYELLGGGPLYDAHVQAIVVGYDSQVYALINFKPYVYSDNGWQELGPVPDEAMSLTVAPGDPQILYIGSASSGVYRSTDRGQSWQQASNNLGLMPGAPLRVTALAVDKQDPEHVVAGTAYLVGSRLVSRGIYESTNGGRWWTKLDDVDGLVRHLVINESGIHAATTTGMLRYPELNQPSPVLSASGLTWPAQASGVQILILVLTFGLAGLVLLGRLEWITAHHGGRT